MKNIKKYDYIVIGAGSGGTASARYVSSKFNKKVAIIEHKRLGGTCVNVGCMPKKVSYNISTYINQFKRMQNHGITTKSLDFDYSLLKKNRDQYVKGINQYY